MNDYKIVPVDKETISAARKLVNTVFPYQGPLERISLRLFEKKESFLARLLFKIFGVDLLNFWIALSDKNEALAISGLYRTRKDREEALWLGWFAVHPEARGRKIGGAMLIFAVTQAAALEATYLRLYTTDSELIQGAAEAQEVYEHYGFRVKSSRKVFGGLIINSEGIKILKSNHIIREKKL